MGFLDSVGGFLGGLAGNVIGAGINYNVAKQNLASQEKWNERNIAFAKEGLDWQKSEANLTREREDTAIQRRTQDLQAAGLNPLLAAGSPASASTPVSTPVVPHGEAPQNKFKMGNLSVLDGIQVAQALRLGAANISRTESENLLLKERAREQGALADVAELDARIAKDDWYNPSSETMRSFRGHRSFLDTELVNRRAGLASAQMFESEARKKGVDAGTAKQELETAIRARDFEGLKTWGLMDNHGQIVQNWLDIATLADPKVADAKITTDQALDLLLKVIRGTSDTVGLFKK